MELGGKKILVCNCEATMPLDGKALAKACGTASTAPVHHHLCRTEIGDFHNACAAGEPVLVACTQEAPLFRQLQQENHPETPVSFTNIRERAALAFDAPRNGATSRCDLILDLSGGAPLFSAAQRRDGYFRPDPGNPAAVQRALFDLVDLVGEFDKPRYVDFTAALCAHSRSR